MKRINPKLNSYEHNTRVPNFFVLSYDTLQQSVFLNLKS